MLVGLLPPAASPIAIGSVWTRSSRFIAIVKVLGPLPTNAIAVVPPRVRLSLLFIVIVPPAAPSDKFCVNPPATSLKFRLPPFKTISVEVPSRLTASTLSSPPFTVMVPVMLLEARRVRVPAPDLVSAPLVMVAALKVSVLAL